MKRGKFIKLSVAGVLATLILPGETLAAAGPVPVTSDIEYLALDAAIKAMNEFIDTGDKYFWPYIYARLGEMHRDTSWDSAKKIGAQFYILRNELIGRANKLVPHQ